MTDASKTRGRWDDLKEFALAAVLSFVVNAAVGLMLTTPQYSIIYKLIDFSRLTMDQSRAFGNIINYCVLAGLCINVVLAMCLLAVQRYALAAGIVVGLLCGVPVIAILMWSNFHGIPG